MFYRDDLRPGRLSRSGRLLFKPNPNDLAKNPTAEPADGNGMTPSDAMLTITRFNFDEADRGR